MKRSVAAVIALSLLGASVAMADGHHDRDGRDNWSGEHRDFEHRDFDRRHYDGDRWQGRHDGAGDRDWRGGGFHDDEHFRHEEHFEHVWRRGERLSPAYYAPSYVVRDYYEYQLPEPPYGCRWVRVDNNVVLAAIATGVVLDVVYNVF
jgi:Ni/Co efflux regulator RcnB